MCCESQGPAWSQPVKFLTGEEGEHLWRERVSLASLASQRLLPAPPLLWQPSAALRPHSAPVAQLQRLPRRHGGTFTATVRRPAAHVLSARGDEG